MKWPSYLMLIRHDTSEYNVLKSKKSVDHHYLLFQKLFETRPTDPETVKLAQSLWREYALNCNDTDTPLVDFEGLKARATGEALKGKFEPPDIIFVSPYKRAMETLVCMTKGWPALARVRTYKEERIREQEHGLANLYNDWQIFQTLHPKQRLLYNLMGPYWYQYPQGESVPMVRQRSLLMMNTVIRDFAGKKVLLVCHHLNILAFRANLERLDAEEFVRLDKEEKPINCGVTLYRGQPELGQDGRLVLEFYNKKYY